MSAVFDYWMLRDVKSPVRASRLGANWRSVSFFKQLHIENGTGIFWL
ncbi:MAG TPA: hypothetical protein VN611_11310 [Patescibacteria group bacterium]|nr:hypothetical protein [Patescibacteria group bacterium]